jgi:uncharacterized membrane protein HdeD (DUF308 family)
MNPGNPGDPTNGHPAHDPGYQGAKPASAAGPSDFWGLLGADASPAVSDAMSARLAQNWWVIALRGVVAILFGIIALLMPGPTLAALVLLFAAYMIVDGVLDIVAGVRAAQRHERWGWLVFEGIADLVAAAIALVWPLATIFAFVVLLGAWAIVSGILLWTAAFQLSVPRGRWLMALGGAVSVLWGFLLLVWPFTGAIVLTWWMGAYALVFGVALLVLAFRLRRLRQELPPPAAVPHGA